jgi:hypothetical protein
MQGEKSATRATVQYWEIPDSTFTGIIIITWTEEEEAARNSKTISAPSSGSEVSSPVLSQSERTFIPHMLLVFSRTPSIDSGQLEVFVIGRC